MNELYVSHSPRPLPSRRGIRTDHRMHARLQSVPRRRGLHITLSAKCCCWKSWSAQCAQSSSRFEGLRSGDMHRQTSRYNTSRTCSTCGAISRCSAARIRADAQPVPWVPCGVVCTAANLACRKLITLHVFLQQCMRPALHRGSREGQSSLEAQFAKLKPTPVVDGCL